MLRIKSLVESTLERYEMYKESVENHEELGLTDIALSSLISDMMARKEMLNTLFDNGEDTAHYIETSLKDSDKPYNTIVAFKNFLASPKIL